MIVCHGPDAGLSAVRALNRHGVTVTAALFDDNVAGFSRAASARIAVRGGSLAERRAGTIEALRALPGDERRVLFATSDISLDVLCDYRDELEKRFALLLPDSEAVRKLSDKVAETAWVASLGFDLPKSIGALPPTAEELLDRLRLPVIVKLRKHEYWSVLERKNVILRTREAVDRFYATHGAASALLAPQELIEAPDEASWVLNPVFDRQSRVASMVVKQKLRMYPAHYGPATVAVSAWNSELVDLTERMGAAMGMVGPSCFEFRQDPRDGRWMYIENNPRLAGGCSGADYDEAMGVPSALVAYRLALGLPPGEWRQRNGVYYCACMIDLRARRVEGERAWSILREHAALALRVPVSRPLFSWRDPAPAAVATARWWKARLARG